MLQATIDELRTIALAADDASGYFPAMYARFTERVEAAAADGRLGDAEPMRRFARTFAEWYLAPVRGERPTPRCWAAAGDVAGDRSLLVLQQLLLGINAHVNHDLPQVVVELAAAGDGDLDAMRPGFDAINDLLAETYPELVRDVGRVAGWMATASAWGGGWMFNFSLHNARRVAWLNAVGLDGAAPSERAQRVEQLDELCCVLAFLVTRPSWPVSWTVPLLRRLESADPRAVTTALLGHLA
jgi:hypothetical protein